MAESADDASVSSQKQEPYHAGPQHVLHNEKEQKAHRTSYVGGEFFRHDVRRSGCSIHFQRSTLTQYPFGQ